LVSEPTGADDLVFRLLGLLSAGTPVTVFMGSGVTGTAIPSISGILRLADDYAEDRPDRAGLIDALRRAREENLGKEIDTYLAYRRAFAAWVSGNEFDVVAQEAVLEAYRPPDPTLLKTRGRWQRVEAALGDRLEADVDNWVVPDGLAAFGALIAARPEAFNSYLVTTNFDPLVEIAIMRTGRGATSVPLTPDGTDHPIGTDERSIQVYHLHGYWRPDLESNNQRLLHDPDYLAQQRPALGTRVKALIRSDVILVLGHSGWDGVLEEAVRQLSADGRRLTLLWGEHAADPQEVQRQRDRLNWLLVDGLVSTRTRPVVEVFPGVDSNRLLPDLARQLKIPVPERRSLVRRRRHPRWERELISEAGVQPPDDAVALLRQLDRRYQWERSWTDAPAQPSLLFWPVRLRPSPSVIHMAQAFAAAALSARAAEVIVCVDDYNVEDRDECDERFRAEVERWFMLVPGSNRPEFVSLEKFIERPENPVLPRNSRPWEVAREALGEHNPSVLSILMAAKIIPDRLADNAAMIVRELRSQPARRLLTPLTLWSHLNYLIADRQPATGSLMTLGGREEKGLWDLWREVYDHGVHQLYNPQIHSLTNQSLMLRWAEPDQLRSYLLKELDRPGWEEPGRYLYWLVQNAFLLPTYVSGGAPPTFDGHRLDSWATVYEAMRTDTSVIDLIVKQVCAVYLG
jgi:hypothetical protein